MLILLIIQGASGNGGNAEKTNVLEETDHLKKQQQNCK
jgi:hypothetical protein